VFINTPAWRETSRTLDDLSEGDQDIIDQYADINLRISAENLKRVWLYISIFLVPFVTFVIAKDIWQNFLGWPTVIAALVVLIVGLQSYAGYKSAFLIKMSVECYVKSRKAKEVASRQQPEQESRGGG
jgi:hypothetical protein